MQRMISSESRAGPAQGIVALWTALATGLLALTLPGEARAWPKEVGPFAYIANPENSSISVFDTQTNKVAATISLGEGRPFAIAVTPNGKRAYVLIEPTSAATTPGIVAIDTDTNRVVTKIPATVGNGGGGLAITPDGKYVYVSTAINEVLVIDTSANRIVATVPVISRSGGAVVTPDGKRVYIGTSVVAVIDVGTNKGVTTVSVGSTSDDVVMTPDGKHVYMTQYPGDVAMIDTRTNKVTAKFAVGRFGAGIAVAPDGKHVYVANAVSSNVSVIDTRVNRVVATIPLGSVPFKIAVTPNGRRAYVTNSFYDVRVIDTATNTLVALPRIPSTTSAIAFVPPPPGLPFHEFKIAKLDIDASQDILNFYSYVTLSSAISDGIHPDTEPVTLTIGDVATKIPAGSFKKQGDGSYIFLGFRQGVQFDAYVRPTGASRYLVHVLTKGADVTGITNPAQAVLTIGDDSGLASVKADLFP